MGWDGGTVVGSQTYHTWMQEKGSSCGPACVLMIGRLAFRKRLDETIVRRWFGDAEGGHTRNKVGIRDFSEMGSTREPVVGVLAERLKLINTRTVEGATESVRYAKRCTPSKPGILFVRWLEQNIHGDWVEQDYAHWVVVVGMDGEDVVCLDPEAGVVRMTAEDQKETRYGVTYPGDHSKTWGYVERVVITQ